MAPSDLHISVTHAITVHDLPTWQVVGGSATTGMAANAAYLIGVPQPHVDDWPRRQPDMALVSFSMAGALGVYATARYVRRWWSPS